MFFFFSSRRRHTRFDCDWSSDVCSSDLSAERGERPRCGAGGGRGGRAGGVGVHRAETDERRSETRRRGGRDGGAGRGSQRGGGRGGPPRRRPPPPHGWPLIPRASPPAVVRP